LIPIKLNQSVSIVYLTLLSSNEFHAKEGDELI